MPPAQCGLRASADPTSSVPTSAAATPPRAIEWGFTLIPPSSEAVPVHREPELAPQERRRLAARQHPAHEDLEILHDLRDGSVDRQLQRNELLPLVHVEKALLDGVVHAIVDVEANEVGIAHPRAVHV